MNVPHASFAELDFRRLIPVDQAAEMIGIDERSLRRRCMEKYQSLGLAFFTQAPDGGQPKWFIDRAASPELETPEEQARNTSPDLRRYTAAQAERAMQRAWCVDRLRAVRFQNERPGRAAEDGVIQEARRKFPTLQVSRSRLYAWMKVYRFAADLENLIDQRGGKRQRVQHAEAWTAFEDLFLDQNAPTLADCWRTIAAMAKEHGWRPCSSKRRCRGAFQR